MVIERTIVINKRERKKKCNNCTRIETTGVKNTFAVT